MTTQNYLIVERNAVTNIVVWDGSTNTWTPPVGATMLVEATTPAEVWQLNSTYTAWELVEVVGAGQIGFIWDGVKLTTNEPQPADPTVSTVSTSGTVSA